MSLRSLKEPGLHRESEVFTKESLQTYSEEYLKGEFISIVISC